MRVTLKIIITATLICSSNEFLLRELAEWQADFRIAAQIQIAFGFLTIVLWEIYFQSSLFWRILCAFLGIIVTLSCEELLYCITTLVDIKASSNFCLTNPGPLNHSFVIAVAVCSFSRFTILQLADGAITIARVRE